MATLFEYVVERWRLKYVFGPGFQIFTGRLAQPCGNFWRQETEPPLQQAFQDRALPLDATLLHASFDALLHALLHTFFARP